jgi:hypothetical protein
MTGWNLIKGRPGLGKGARPETGAGPKPGRGPAASPRVLDPCCGSKMFWFDKHSPDVLYGDCREGTTVLCDGRGFAVSPDQILDFRNLPFSDCWFHLVVFDPPHLRSAGERSWIGKKYGRLDPASWRQDIQQGFAECWRVLAVNGTLIFKWNETQIKLSELRPLFPAQPLFGQTTTQNLKTHWIVFFKAADR